MAGAIRRVALRLSSAGIPDAADEARRLIAAALGLDALRLILDADRPLTPHECAALDAALDRRSAREPLSRIQGRREFYGRTFEVTPATLDPRADSETLIEVALTLVAEEGWLERPLRILDIGTGTGCLLLTLLSELQRATGVATDIDAAALAVARRNAHHLAVAGRAEFLQARSLDGITGIFDLVVSNPPYIPHGDIAGLQPEVRCYDPVTALDGGPDGLAVYRDIAAGIPRVLPDGWLILEVGAGQAAEVPALFAPPATLTVGDTRFRQDLGGHIRAVAVRTRQVTLR